MEETKSYLIKVNSEVNPRGKFEVPTRVTVDEAYVTFNFDFILSECEAPVITISEGLIHISTPSISSPPIATNKFE